MTTALDVLLCPQWTAIYRSKKHPTKQVVLNSVERPDAKREFFVTSKGLAVFTAVSVTPLNEPKEGFKMATKTKKRGKSKKSAKQKREEEELEELEGLDDLDDEEEDEEPEDEDEDDVEEDDDEEEEDEDEEEDEPPAKKRKGKKSKSKTKSKSKKRGPTGPREMPKGKLSAQDVAEMADTDARSVRLFLRKKANKKKFPKDEELGRYAFNKTEAKAIVKAMKASAKDDDEDEDDE
jgi:hypothetical protein